MFVRQLWNSFKIALSMYSKVPMPHSDWTEENMRYAMCFFPLVGMITGVLTLFWHYFADIISLRGTAFSAIILLLIPMVVSGGIHFDGFVDTSDALSSYQPQEKRLEILKDPRTGAFGVIYAILYFLIYYGIYSLAEAQSGKGADLLWKSIALTFVLSRSLSGFSVVTFRKAKNTGLAAAFSDGAQKRTVQITMLFLFLLTISLLCMLSLPYAIAAAAAVLLVFFGYRRTANQKFGGITGDLAGWFLQIAELSMAFALTAVYWMIYR